MPKPKLDLLDKRAVAIHLDPIPEGKSGHMLVGHHRPSHDVIGYFGIGVPYPHSFDYLKDTETDTIWMSATPQEIHDLLPYLDKFPTYGSLVMSGLGLGLVLRLLDYLHKSPSRVTIIERDQDVINLVWPHVQKEGYSIINVDIAEWLEGPGLQEDRYDLVVLDTWPFGDYLYLPWVERLKAGAKYIQKPGGHIFLWTYDRMISGLRNELYDLIDLVASRKINWTVDRPGFKAQWPFFSFMDWLMTTWSTGALAPTAWKRLAWRRANEEIEAFQKGERDGLKHTT